MYTVFWKIFKYVLRLILIAIVLLLLVGLAKNNRDVKGYIQLLNEKSRSESREQGGIPWIFRGEALVDSTGDMELLTGEDGSEVGTWIDVYDPSFEEDLNEIPQDTLSSGDYGDAETDFGFTTDGSGEYSSTWTSKSQQLLDIIKNEK